MIFHVAVAESDDLPAAGIGNDPLDQDFLRETFAVGEDPRPY
jgi:hypothetical protein